MATRLLPRASEKMLSSVFRSMAFFIGLFVTVCIGADANAAGPTRNSAVTNSLEIEAELDRLESRRSDLAVRRDKAFVESKSRSFAARFAKAKLDDLGRRPGEGESESPLVEKKRLDLEKQLERLELPQRAARDRYIRYQVQVEILDERIRFLRKRQLLTRSSSPIWPQGWAKFGSEVGSKLRSLSDRPNSRMPAAIVLLIASLLAGVVAVAAARIARSTLRWFNRRIELARDEARRLVTLIAKDFGFLAVLLTGLAVLLGILVLAGSFDDLFSSMAGVFVAIAVPILIANWIGQSLFSPGSPEFRFVPVDDWGAKHSVRIVTGLGASIGLESLVEFVERESPFTVADEAIAPFVSILIAGVLLYSLGRTILHHRIHQTVGAMEVAAEIDAQLDHERMDFARLAATAMKLAGVVAILVAAVGYIELSRRILLPTIATLAVGAFLILTFSRIRRIGGQLAARWLSGSRRHHPVARFFGALVLILASLPLFATFWGLRPAELLDFVGLLRDGITVGETTISFGNVFTFLAVFLIGYVLTRWLQRVLEYTLLSRIGLDEGTRSALITGIGYVGILIAVMVAIAVAGFDLSSLAIIAGALSVGIGFGLQSVVSNFVSGIILLIERPIKKGDWIEVGSVSGIVEKIAVRATRIKAFNRDDVIVPNSELIAGIVRNKTYADTLGRVETYVGIAYESDVDEAIKLVKEVAASHEEVLKDPDPSVMIESLGDSALVMKVFSYIGDVRRVNKVRTDLYLDILEKFQAAGIEIPFPQQEIRFRRDRERS